MLAETNVEQICHAAQGHKPSLLVVDSIQVMHSSEVPSAPGSVSQVRECAAYLIQYAKQTNTVLFLIGHVTKEGNLAGPKVLEHMSDWLTPQFGDDALRYAMSITVMVNCWCAFHYFMAAKTIREDIARAPD